VTAALSCPACHEPVLAADAYCEGCGERLGPAATTGPPVTPTPVPASPVPASPAVVGPACPCGSGHADADGYCDECGRLVPDGRDHVEIELGSRAAVVSDRGLRHSRNEDAGAVAEGAGGSVIAVVADGVSTSQDPQAASAAATAAAVRVLVDVPGVPTDDELAAAVTAASTAVAAATDPRLLGQDGLPRAGASVPACTLVAVHLSGRHMGRQQASVLNVGDSRAYWLPDDGPARLLSVEDSWAADAIAAGVPAAQAYADPRAHTITAWIGVDSGPVTPRLSRFTAPGPGAVVVCSDGLWNYLSDLGEFTEVVRTHLVDAAGSALTAARTLTEFARAAGGRDNITVAVVPVGGSPE